MMRMYKLKYIYYSDKNGILCKEKIKNIEDNHNCKGLELMIKYDKNLFAKKLPLSVINKNKLKITFICYKNKSMI